VGPESELHDGIELVRFTPEMPVREGSPTPRSSSLESAVLAANSTVVFVDPESAIARALMPRLEKGRMHASA
jgi:hypothetical protein